MPSLRLGFRASDKTLGHDTYLPETHQLSAKATMSNKETDLTTKPVILRAHRFSTVIQGRQLSFDLPADFPTGEVEVIVLIDEKQAVDRNNEFVATHVARMRQAQTLIQEYAPPNGASMVDELIAERRAEADRE